MTWFLHVKVLGGAPNQEKALEGAFSVIVKSSKTFVRSSNMYYCDSIHHIHHSHHTSHITTQLRVVDNNEAAALPANALQWMTPKLVAFGSIAFDTRY